MAMDVPFANGEFAKMFEKMAMPGLDMRAVMAAQQKNMQALQKANQAYLDGAQLVMRREFEIFQANVEAALNSMQDVMKESDPKLGTQKGVDLFKGQLEKALANTRELSQLVGKANQEAFEILNTRCLECFDDVKNAVNKTPTA